MEMESKNKEKWETKIKHKKNLKRQLINLAMSVLFLLYFVSPYQAQHGSSDVSVKQKLTCATCVATRNILDCDQSNYSWCIILPYSCETALMKMDRIMHSRDRPIFIRNFPS